MKDKTWAIDRLRRAKNSAVISYGAMALLNSPSAEALQGSKVLLTPDGSLTFNPDPAECVGARYEVDLSQIPQNRANEPAFFEEKLAQFWAASRRNLLVECYEILWAYAEARHLVSDLQAQPWYRFARTIRHSMAHDLHIRIHPKDRPFLPISWGGKSIDASMEGMEMKRNLLDPYVTHTLLDEMESWVAAHD
ncbi:MAG: hypothetical protein WBW32_03985 [Luteibacter sp.]